jgi:hypothetical protein
MNQFGYKAYIHGKVTMKLPVTILNNLFFKNREQEGKIGPVLGVWYQWEGRGYKEDEYGRTIMYSCINIGK